MFEKFKIFFGIKWRRIASEHFIDDNNKLRRLVFNVLTVLFFGSIVLTMGFTRIYPLNILLKILFLLTNILIVLYLLIFGEIRFDKFLLLIVFSLIWFFAIAFLNNSIVAEQSLLLNILNMIPLYTMSASSKKFRRTFYRAIVIGLLIYTFAFTFYYSPYLIRFNFDNRLGDAFGNQNDVAATLLIAVTIFFYFSFSSKYMYIIPALLSLINLLSTGSRAGVLNASLIIIFMFICIFYWIFYRYSHGRYVLCLDYFWF